MGPETAVRLQLSGSGRGRGLGIRNALSLYRQIRYCLVRAIVSVRVGGRARARASARARARVRTRGVRARSEGRVADTVLSGRAYSRSGSRFRSGLLIQCVDHPIPKPIHPYVVCSVSPPLVSCSTEPVPAAPSRTRPNSIEPGPAVPVALPLLNFPSSGEGAVVY